MRQHCGATAGVPMCTDDDWVSKCPSGCRLQGLISQKETELETKLLTVCEKGKMYEDAAEKSMKTKTHFYNHNRKIIVQRHMTEVRFVEVAEALAWNLTCLRKRSSSLSQQLKELHRKAHKQIKELYRTEVDIDLQIRACQGSCRSVVPFAIDHGSYVTLQTDMVHVEKRKAAPVPPGDIPHISLKPVDVGLASSGEYKTIPMVQRELPTLFQDIGLNQVVLDQRLEESADGKDHGSSEGLGGGRSDGLK